MLTPRSRGLILALGGLLLTGSGAWFGYAHVALVRHGERAPGEVVDLQVRRVRGQKLYHPVVRFRPAGKGETRFTEKVGLWPSPFTVGDRVTVLYRNETGIEPKIDSFWTLWCLPLAMILLGAGCIVAARYEISHVHRQPQRKAA